MTVEIIMKPGAIVGENKKFDKNQWVTVKSISHGVAQDVTPESMKQTRDRLTSPRFSFMTVRKRVDVSTPDLLMHCMAGLKLPTVEIMVFQSSDSGKPLMHYTLQNCFIASAHAVGEEEASEEPMEDISFAYSTIKLEVNSVVTGGGQMTKGWNLAEGKEL